MKRWWRGRLIKALLAFIVMFVVCFFFAKNIYNILLVPYEHAAGPGARLIFTAPQEYFFTQIQVALFAAAFLACCVPAYAWLARGRRVPLRSLPACAALKRERRDSRLNRRCHRS